MNMINQDGSEKCMVFCDLRKSAGATGPRNVCWKIFFNGSLCSITRMQNKQIFIIHFRLLKIYRTHQSHSGMSVCDPPYKSAKKFFTRHWAWFMGTIMTNKIFVHFINKTYEHTTPIPLRLHINTSSVGVAGGTATKLFRTSMFWNANVRRNCSHIIYDKRRLPCYRLAKIRD